VIHKRAIVLSACFLLLILGILALRSLPIQPYPGVAPLTIQAISQWPGRGTTEVEQQITIPVENALAGIPGVQTFRSVSLFGLSVVTGEIMRYQVASNHADSIQLKTLQNYEIYKELKQTPGVAEVSSFGGKVRQYQIIVRPESLQAKGITLAQLVLAISSSNANTGGGLLPSGEQQFVVRGVGLLKNVQDIKQVVVSNNNGIPIRVGDVAEVKIGHAPRLGMFQFNDQSDEVELCFLGSLSYWSCCMSSWVVLGPQQWLQQLFHWRCASHLFRWIYLRYLPT